MFGRKPKANALVSVCPVEDGIALAQVEREGGTSPALGLCLFHPMETAESSDLALTKLVKAHNLDRYACTSIMEIGSYNLLLVEAPDVPAPELRAAMRWRVKDLIDFHIDDAVIDVFEVSEDQASGRNRMMYAVVARSGAVKQRVDLLSAAGLNLSVIDIPELAMRNIASLLPEDVSGVGLIYLLGGGGLITISRQGKLYLSRHVDTLQNAEAALQAFYAIESSTQAWLDRIVIELQRSMDYYESHFSQPPITHLVIAPMQHAVAGIEEYLAGKLRIPVRTLDLNTLIDTDPLSNEIQHQCLFAIGAALRSEGKSL